MQTLSQALISMQAATTILQAKSENIAFWIGVDFDGTLVKQAKYPAVGPPVMKMVREVRNWVKNGVKVDDYPEIIKVIKIFTARAGDAKQRAIVQAWTKKYLGKTLEVTNVKDSGLVRIVDNIAVRVEKDKGTIIQAELNKTVHEYADNWDKWIAGKGPLFPDLQAKAYKLAGKTVFRGLPISIETKKGQVRKGIGSDNKPWKVVMPFDYGYIRGTEGADGQHVDCFIGPNEKADNVYVIHQCKEDDKTKYDEDKVMLGFNSPEEAKKAYKAAYHNVDLFKGMHTFNFEDFEEAISKSSNRGKALECSWDKVIRYLQANSKSKCPACGSKKYSLMPTDFETAKCQKCGKTWDVSKADNLYEEPNQTISKKGMRASDPAAQLSGSYNVVGIVGHVSPRSLYLSAGGPGSGRHPTGRKQYQPHPRQSKQAQPAPKQKQATPGTSISQKGKVVSTDRQTAALKNPVRIAFKEQNLAESVVQQMVAKALGGKVWGSDSEPLDVLTKGPDGKTHGVEVKAVINQQASAREAAGQLPQISMKNSAVQLKQDWSKQNKAPIHTVIVDVRQSLKNPVVYHAYGCKAFTFSPDPKQDARAGAKRVPGGLAGLKKLVFAKTKDQVIHSSSDAFYAIEGQPSYENISYAIGNDDAFDTDADLQFNGD